MSRIGKPLTLRLVTSYVLCLSLLLQPLVALADTPLEYTIHYLPKGKALKVNSKQYRCFDFEETKLLLKFDRELFTCEMELSETTSIKEKCDLIILEKSKHLELSHENYLTILNDRDRISEKWIKTDKQLQNAIADKEWWRSLTFIGIGVGILGGIIGGMIIHASVK